MASNIDASIHYIDTPETLLKHGEHVLIEELMGD